jgi:hypothetical protein
MKSNENGLPTCRVREPFWLSASSKHLDPRHMAKLVALDAHVGEVLVAQLLKRRPRLAVVPEPLLAQRIAKKKHDCLSFLVVFS